MNKCEIIERLKNVAGYAVHTVGEEPFVMSLDDGIAVHEAIELLKKPETNCSEIPNNSDTISRHVAIEAVEKSMSENPHENEIHRGMHDHEHRHFLTILMGLPPAQSERPKGEWTKDGACQFCGFQPWYERDIHTLSFCPNCGADMRGEQDDT